MLNYEQLRKNFKNNSSGNFIENPFPKPTAALISSPRFIVEFKISDWNPVAEGCLIQ